MIRKIARKVFSSCSMACIGLQALQRKLQSLFLYRNTLVSQNGRTNFPGAQTIWSPQSFAGHPRYAAEYSLTHWTRDNQVSILMFACSCLLRCTYPCPCNSSMLCFAFFKKRCNITYHIITFSSNFFLR